MVKKKLAVEIVWSELLLCGGEWKTRKAIWEELLAEGFERQYVDYYLFCLSENQPKENAMQEEINKQHKGRNEGIRAKHGTELYPHPLSQKQEEAVQHLRETMQQEIVVRIEAFYKQHPELRVYFDFSLRGVIRIPEDES